jgi:hypothetical protein
MSERKKLSDILPRSDRERMAGVWASARPADDLKPIPAGEYQCRIIDGALFNAKSGTAGYKLTLEVAEGDCAGRRLWHDVWLSEAAVSLAKRDLGKLGVTSLEQLEQPLPEGIVIDAKVALRRGDDGTEFNRITRFDVVGIEPAEPEPFAPAPSSNGPAPSVNGEAAGPDGDSTLDQQGFDWGSGEQQDPSAPGRGRGAYSQP